MGKQKKKPTNEVLKQALIDLGIGLILLIIDRLIG